MSIRKPLIGFSFFAIVSILVTWVIWSTLQRSVDGPTNDYSATFSDVLGLKAGDDVRMAGVRVGRVSSIELDDKNNATVDFVVERDQQLYDNTKALVRYQNLIGQRYVSLAPGEGKGNPLADGGTIPLERTEPSFDVSALLGGFEPLFSVLQPKQVNNLTETLIQALQGDGVSLSTFITQAASVASEFQQRDVILGDIIDNLSGVMEGLAARGDQLETLLTQTRTLLTGLYEQGQSLQNSTVQLADSTTAIVNMVGQVQPKLAQTQRSANDAIGMLISHGAQLDQTAISAPTLLTDLARITSNGAFATTYVCDLDVSLWGVLLPERWFSTVSDMIFGQRHSEVCR